MTATPIRDDRGQSAARVTCDGCGHQVEIRVKHETRNNHDVRLPGHYLRKLNDMGWSATSTRHTCPSCVAAKRQKPQEEPEISVTTEIPAPNRDQKREIMQMLNDVYDAKAQRYRGEESDHSVAHALGIERWGWVSQIREEFFGPDGNEAKDTLIAEAKQKIMECDILGAKLHDDHDAIIKSLRHFNETKTQLVALLERLQGKPATGQKPQQLVAR